MFYIKKKLLFICFFLILFFTSYTQISLDAEIRPRFEYRNGYKIMATDAPNYQINQRTRLPLKYQDDLLSIGLTFQDVRIWGDQQQRTHTPTLGFYEAWAAYKLNDFYGFKVGRQTISYDNERLLGVNNWIQQGQSHDAFKFFFKKNTYEFDIIGAFNQGNDLLAGTHYPLLLNNYKSLNIISFKKRFDNAHFRLLGILDGHQKPQTTNTTYLRLTYGALLNYDISSNFNIKVSAYKQEGKSKMGYPINAYYHHSEMLYKPSKWHVCIGYEYFSGKKMPDTLSHTIKSFDALYGAGHKFNGSMDFFTNIPLHTKNAGFFNPFINLTYLLSDNFSSHISYHHFRLANAYYKDEIEIKKYLGYELDFSVKYALQKDLMINFGYSFLIPTQSMAAIKDRTKEKFSDFAYIMLTVKPHIIKKEL